MKSNKVLCGIILGILIMWFISSPALANTPATAGTLPLNGAVSGSVSSTSTDDWWKVVTTQDGKLTASITGTAATNGYLDIYDASGTNYFTYVYVSGATAKSVSWDLRPGTYYIRVERSSGDWSYTLSNTLTPAPLSDDLEGNGAYTAASILSVNVPATGHIGYSYNTSTTDTDDWWKVVTTQDGKLNVTITGTEATNGYLDLYDGSGINYFTYVYVTGTTPKSISWNLQPGTYYIRVERSSGAWSYTLSNTFTTGTGIATPTATITPIPYPTYTSYPTATYTPSPTTTGTTGTIVTIQSAGGSSIISGASSSVVPVSIVAKNVQNLGAATITLSYDPGVVTVQSVSAGNLGSPVSNINNIAGTTQITSFSLLGKSGNVTIANLELKVAGSTGANSPLTLSVSSLGDSNGNSIPYTISSGQLSVVQYLRGDMNCDNVVNIIDALLIAKYTVGLIPAPYTC